MMVYHSSKLYLLLAACFFSRLLYAQNEYVIDSLLFEDRFEQLQPYWVIETGTAAPAKVYAEKNKLVIDAVKDATVWLNKKLEGNILIECHRTVLLQNGNHDRLSDLNFFWMAKDPGNANLFTRNGVFREYDSLQLYYAGIGGNNNTTSRFRKYEGNGGKNILQAYEDAAHLLQPNKEYYIRILVKNGVTALWVDEECFFSFQDPRPLQSGYFGFRTTKSRQAITHLKIYRVK